MEPTIYKPSIYKGAGIYKTGDEGGGGGGGGIVVETENIGGQDYLIAEMPDGKTWMLQNLDYKFDGCGIGGTSGHTTPWAYYYNNDESTYGINGGKKCGLLYNNYAFTYLENNRSDLIPGWRCAMEADWNALRNATGSSGKILKANDNSIDDNWPINWGGYDALFFNVLPAGGWTSPFEHIGDRAYYWSAKSSSNIIMFTNSGVSGSGIDRSYAASVRLIKTT